MAQQLDDWLRCCTVKITIPGSQGWGTGFFVAPGLILTCAHVVKAASANSVTVFYPEQNQSYPAILESLPEANEQTDLVLLKLQDSIPAHPCVYLDKAIALNDRLYSYGYPDNFSEGAFTTFESEALTGGNSFIKFKAGQVRPGMSGSPLLNQSTGKICGIVKFTRDRSIDLGGGAIPTRVILKQFPQLRELQQQFHQGDRRWSDLVAKLSEAEAVNQTNSGGTNYQTQTGDNSTTFIGGEHYHHNDLSQVKQTVKKILMLSANPENPETSRRRKEIREIRSALSRAKHKDLFDLQDRSDTGAADLSEELLIIEPFVVDISGHENGIENLVLENISDDAMSGNSKKLIAQLFELHAKSIECVILNRCYLEEQAREVVQYIEFVIGISQSLKDSETLDFLKAFYVHLGSERTVEDSHRAGCYALKQKGLDNTQLPILLKKRDEIRRRELEEELKFCDKEIEKDRNNVTLWRKRADILKNLNRPEEASSAYEKATLIEPKNYKIRAEQGDVLEQFGKHEKAVTAYNKALELEKEDYKVWWKKGQVLVEGRNYDESIESYENAIALEPPSPDNYVICREYGSVLKRLGQYQKSICLYKKSLGLESRYRASSYEKKQVYKNMYFEKG